ncbi:MAG: MFS transporter [Cyclobacteriaceae bacterium]|jgi:MFS family permease|nr:MFS transporter [Cytophagales bacterium]HNP78335.1 MFS transporter [Cyclobacteriaceae bacterium]
MSNPYAVLQIRDFRLFISARFCVTLAIQMQALVVGWQVYEITKDALSLGLIGLAEALPSIVVSLYAGHLADVVQRKRIIVITLATLVLCSVGLLFFTLDVGAFLLAEGVYPIYAVIFVSGIARGFITPAIFSFMPQLVPRELFQNAISWNSTLWEMASIGGPPIGGLIYGVFGVTAAYAIDASLMITGLILAAMVASRPLPEVSDEQGIVEKIKAGLKFVIANKLILNAISLDLFAVLFGGAVALLPIFSDQILHVGSLGLGFLRSAPGMGALVMAIYLTHNPIRKSMGKILLYAVAGFGLCMIGFALSREFWLSMVLLILSGGFDCISVIVRGTLLQTLTPENMKGRVSAVNNIFIGSSNEIGMFESGVAARLLGVVPSVIFGGLMTLVVVGFTAWKAPTLRKLQKVH